MMGLLALLGRTDSPGASPAPGDAAETEALRRLARGEPEGLAALYDRHARAVFSLAVRIVRDQGAAEEVVQDVFAQVWRQASRYDPSRGTVVAWLLTIARSRAIDHLRRRSGVRAGPGREQPLPDSIADPGPLPEASALTDEQVRLLRVALEGLPLLQRLAIELAYYEGLSHSEIAERLEQPLGTVKTRIRLGLLKLRDAMEGAS